MSSSFTSLRSQATQVDATDSAPTGDELVEGRTYFDTTTGRLYVYVNAEWRYLQMTSTSTSTTTVLTTTSTSISTSTTSSSTSTTSSSTSSTSSSTSTTLL